MGVVLAARPVLLIATVVWVLWRLITWRRGRSGDAVREIGIAALFAWSLVIVRLTFFPLVVIFYDWHGAWNVLPFASIYQLLTETPATVAFENIVGNIVLFAPLGVLLPLLFRRLQSWRDMLWRAAAISMLIEATQFLTRARSVDVDDIILNTAGAMFGYGCYRILAALACRSTAGRTAMERLASSSRTEPLLSAVIPVVLTVLITVPMMGNQVFDATLSHDDTIAMATSGWPNALIGAENSIEDHTYIVVSEGGEGGPMRLATFQRVLPGRFTALSAGDEPAFDGSRYATSISAFNPSEGEQPILAVWGYNDGPAAAVTIAGNGLNQTFQLSADEYFVVGAEFVHDSSADTQADFDLVFTDNFGDDITSKFTTPHHLSAR